MNTILLIEDNAGIMDTNKEYLESQGYSILTASTLLEGQAVLENHMIALIILDIMLPDGSGIDFCRQVRESRDVPVLFLSCLDEKHHIIEGLKSGGDDYMTKPYDLEEMLIRCQTILRRTQLRNQSEIIKVSSLSLDKIKQKAYLNGQDVYLTPKEFALLLFFVRHPHEKFTAGELYRAVWDMPDGIDIKTVKVHIHYLRKKLRLTDEDSEFSITMSDKKHYIWKAPG